MQWFAAPALLAVGATGYVLNTPTQNRELRYAKAASDVSLAEAELNECVRELKAKLEVAR
ncbi:MAG: hypothetical protein HYR96_14570 [Deltaproteobacteria bacterium]|nr:hypothetical protein [Deltaproteobacteria bacterium]MBI3295714.1 hypothetical protein [Deltaproteobacteria bacterium]